ncbi:methylaspartate mutase accessory protein GlmL [Vagococcus elongatus]|uniref:methylaspartate mutase accessory protein GlmL n=1 Tax=Vagococcus elongatus TaxID=180344 RepID=UPI001476F8AB|nr:methylaspartate mutase accessory protein GlmL [Vagococcus elongatus]
MEKNVLLVDFGSTYTKFTAIDIKNSQIINRLTLPTSHETNISTCFKQGREFFEQKAHIADFDDIFICSSAWGGFRMIAIGLTDSLTTEAAKRSALGAGTRLIKTYSYKLTKDQVADIDHEQVDIILLCGGTDGGNQEIILHNATMLNDHLSSGTILIAGNKEAVPKIKAAFTNSNLTLFYTENVMPKVNVLNPEPVREIARDIFMEKIIQTNGIDDMAKIASSPILPTPAAVLKAAELLAEGLPDDKGIGPSMVIDIGGATTDVFTIGNPPITDDNTFFEGLEEPYAKRTVEGDLGMRYSAESLLEVIGMDAFTKMLPFDSNPGTLQEAIHYRTQHPTFIAKTEQDIEIDTALAAKAVELSVNRHAGTIRFSRTPNRTISYQKGKDLRNFKTVIGTGGVITYHSSPKKILKFACSNGNEYLKPEAPAFFVDKHYLLSSLGLLSQKYPKTAFKLLKQMMVPC